MLWGCERVRPTTERRVCDGVLAAFDVDWGWWHVMRAVHWITHGALGGFRRKTVVHEPLCRAPFFDLVTGIWCSFLISHFWGLCFSFLQQRETLQHRAVWTAMGGFLEPTPAATHEIRGTAYVDLLVQLGVDPRTHFLQRLLFFFGFLGDGVQVVSSMILGMHYAVEHFLVRFVLNVYVIMMVVYGVTCVDVRRKNLCVQPKQG